MNQNNIFSGLKEVLYLIVLFKLFNDFIFRLRKKF